MCDFCIQDEIANRALDDIIDRVLEQSLSHLATRASTLERFCLEKSGGEIESAISSILRDQIEERVRFERELIRRRVRTLLTDEQRNRLVAEVVAEQAKALISREVRLNEAVSEEKDILINETIYELLQEMSTVEFEAYKAELALQRVENALKDSWISSKFFQ